MIMPQELQRNPPFRAEHLGSLLRPQDLLRIRNENEQGSVEKEQLRSAEDKAIKWIVSTQLSLGYHSISDGEHRRHSKQSS